MHIMTKLKKNPDLTLWGLIKKKIALPFVLFSSYL